MTRPAPTRPTDLTARRLVAAEDALMAVLGLDGDLTSHSDRTALRSAAAALYDLRLELARRVEPVKVDHLGPCDTCDDVVRPGMECSECLEEGGVVRHDACCDE